ncbi:MAG: hypothetical protein A2W90_01165 [Bacteroidetes bacterium GWF2_42_66]|nr:MAG: hypothetical protein A2W92_00585 [Bacteroidetes bacterium GWA2_42_15]OFY00989.1 MAG: hypothetical protein A2W89_14655 [Bacteroidetes bacterium GWE2_42_39]OFY41829.1 MAG: hypothetical protein A2W90_01165 [Bacteroidetes bacterium GWF2_42_66]HBL77999.1 hypothetical protein [Prolixibacteraceae bacterium]HCR90238.1 hypothetical protein [Prolixibacteraceae bacterium]
MNNSIISLLTISIFVLTFQRGVTQDMKEADAWKYMHMLSADEMNRRNEIGKYFQATAPPASPVESLAEFEPMSGVLIRYPSELRFNLLAEITRKDTLIVLLPEDSGSSEKMFWNAIQLYEFDKTRIKMLTGKSNSHWTRDYGPMFIAGKDSIGIVDFIYNRISWGRILDDSIPCYIAKKLKFPYYAMDVVHTGGNYMSDGFGVAASSDIVYSESLTNGLTKEQVDQKMKAYLGIHTYHVVKDPNNTYIDHIDCWGKFLDVDKILIRSVPVTHPQYNKIEAVADYFKNQKSSWGNNYQVFRVYTPNDEPYTNSFIMNKRVFVPVMNGEWDDEALQSYKNAMPGYEVSGFLDSWGSTDALHCRVHEVADKQMVRIKHIPIRGAQGDKTDFTFEATIKAYSGKPLKSDSVLVFYKTDFGLWKSAKMQHTDGDIYLVQLPAFNKNQVVQYYIYAADQSGKRATLPIVGAAAPFAFATSDVFTGIKPTVASCETKVYPNPVRDWLNIEFNDDLISKEISIEIYSVSGQKMEHIEKSGESRIKISMENLSDGIYYIIVTHANKAESFKIIKKNF